MVSAGQRYPSVNFITAVPGGASSTGTINLPPGHYEVFFFGTQTAAGTAPTLLFEAYTDEERTDQTYIPAGLNNDTGPISTGTVTLDVALTALYGRLSSFGSALGVTSSVYIPHGLKWTYTKNGGTAIDLTLVAIPSSPRS